jgi:hypothetical protein
MRLLALHPVARKVRMQTPMQMNCMRQALREKETDVRQDLLVSG